MGFPLLKPTEGAEWTNTKTGKPYVCRDGVWRSAEADVSQVPVSVDPPPEAADGSMWFKSDELDLKIRYNDGDSVQWVPTSSPPDPYDANYVSITGDTMTGRLIFSKKNDEGGIRFLRDDGSNLSSLYKYNDKLTRANLLYGSKFGLYCKDVTNEKNATMLTAEWKEGEDQAQLHLYHVADPVDDVHGVNKRYVDNTIKTEIAALPLDDRPKGMPGTPFRYSNRSGDSLDDGCFHIQDNGSMQISRISADGIEMSSYQKDDFSSNVRIQCHVRGSDKRVLHSMVSSHWYQGQGLNQRIELSVSSRIRDGKAEMVVGTIYYITDGVFNF